MLSPQHDRVCGEFVDPNGRQNLGFLSSFVRWFSSVMEKDGEVVAQEWFDPGRMSRGRYCARWTYLTG